MIRFKDGVGIKGIQPEMLVSLQVVEEGFTKAGLDTIVTAVMNGQHKDGSLHYKGLAIDFRTHHAAGIAEGIIGGIRQVLAPLGFDVLFEAKGLDNEHLHVEFDPKS